MRVIASPAPAVVWDRIDENHRRTRRLLLLLALLLVPFVVALVPVAVYSAYFIMPFVHGLRIGHELFPSDIRASPLELPAAGASVLKATLSLLVLAFVGMLVAAGSIAAWHYMRAEFAVLRRAGAMPIGDPDAPELKRVVENLCLGAGLPVPRIHIVDTLAPNAFTGGLVPERAQLVVTRGLVEVLNNRELEGVIAHELSHIGNRDIRLGTVLAACLAVLRAPIRILAEIHSGLAVLCIVLSSVGLAFAALALASAAAMLGIIVLNGDLLARARDILTGNPEMRGALLIESAMGGVFFAATAGPAFLLWGGQMLGWSLGKSVLNQREFLADADAFALTRDSEGLACALAKLHAISAPTPGSDPSNAHLYVFDPLLATTSWWDRPIMTHPPVEQRIAALTALATFPPESLDRARVAARRWAAMRDRSLSATLDGAKAAAPHSSE